MPSYAFLLAAPALALRHPMSMTAQPPSRRSFVSGAAAALASAAAGPAVAYVLPDLPYDYAALEPSIDAATMKFHHDKHHATYIAGINGKLDEALNVRDLHVLILEACTLEHQRRAWHCLQG